LLVALASLAVVTSTGDEAGVVALETGGASAAAELTGGFNMEDVRQDVRNAVVQAVAARRGRRDVEHQKRVNEELEHVAALKRAEAMKRAAKAHGLSTGALQAEVDSGTKAEVAAERKRQNLETAKAAVDRLVSKAAKDDEVAKELVSYSINNKSLSLHDEELMRNATLDAFDSIPDEEMSAQQRTYGKAIAEAVLNEMDTRLAKAAKKIAGHVKSSFTQNRLLEEAVQKELRPTLAAAATRVGQDVATGKYNGDDFTMTGTSLAETEAEKAQIKADEAIKAKEGGVIADLQKQIGDLSDTEDNEKANAEQIASLKEQLDSAVQKLAIAEETTKEIEAGATQKRISTEQEDQLSIAATKAKVSVINHAAENKAEQANEKIAKGNAAQAYADKMYAESKKTANEQAYKSEQDALARKREINHKADETLRKAAREKRKAQREAERMREKAEKMAVDSGLPPIPKGVPGYGVFEPAGRNKKYAEYKERQGKANELKLKAIRPVVVDNSVHLHMERNEPKGGYKAGGVWG
jgi:hypothetical protein